MSPDAQTTLPLELPPELFSVIASFVPLRSAPPTLRALALCNHHFYNIFRPLLYLRLILRNENDGISVMQRILDEPQLGFAVTELYIMSELSAETRNRKKPFDVVAGLQMLVTRGLLPRLSALCLYLLNGWTEKPNFVMQGRLLPDFWVRLRTECPRLRALMLRNVGHIYGAAWLTGPVIDEIIALPGLSTLRLESKGEPLKAEEDLKILNSLPRLAPLLHTLSLNGRFQGVSVPVLLSLDFPHLRWLRLYNFRFTRDRDKVEGFFRRHFHLQSLALERGGHTWFSDPVEVGFLPNLKHLKATFDDVRALTAILPQLISLRFTEGNRRQVAQFLQSVLRDGLPRLRALEVPHNVLDMVMDTIGHTSKPMFPIARGAPNLEELTLQGMDLTWASSVGSLKLLLAQLGTMERFYFRGMPPRPELLAEFLSSVEDLARVCARLESVTSINAKTLPYVSGVIERDSGGDVITVRLADGVGSLICADENDPFPCNT